MSTDFNKYERKFARWLSKTPVIKKCAKTVYKHLNYVIYKKKSKINTQFNTISVCDTGAETFFGYYDKLPLSSNEQYLIFQETDYPTSSLPNANHPIKVLLKDLSKGTIKAEFKSYAYNWQQGSKLQWLNDNNFIFNDYDTDREIYISKIVDAKSGIIERTIDFPIYDTHKNFALSLSFSRLVILRPDYGYRNQNFEKDFDLSELKNDGIFYVDLENNSQKLLLSLEKIISVENTYEMDSALHKVNHIMISPKGDSFIFLHRYFVNGVKFDRLIFSTTDGSCVKVLSDHEMISHCFWKDNSTIISFMRRFDEGDKYYKIDINTGSISPIGQGIIDKYGDGHISSFKNLLLFDTYPNKARMKKLFVFNLMNEELTKIGEYFEPLIYNGETRCDLHPRWSADGKSIFIDSVHSGKRKLYQVDSSSLTHE